MSLQKKYKKLEKRQEQKIKALHSMRLALAEKFGHDWLYASVFKFEDRFYYGYEGKDVLLEDAIKVEIWEGLDDEGLNCRSHES